jgi:hypothetical protein
MKPIKTIETENFCYPSDPDQFDEVQFALYADGDVIVKNAEGDAIINVDELKKTVDELYRAYYTHLEDQRFMERMSDLEC